MATQTLHRLIPVNWANELVKLGPQHRRGRPRLRRRESLRRRQHRPASRAWIPGARRPRGVRRLRPFAPGTGRHAAHAGAPLQRYRPRAGHAHPLRRSGDLALAQPEGSGRWPAEARGGRAYPAPVVGRLGLAHGLGTAEKVDGGYKVNGQKIFASGSPSADLFMTGAVEQTTDGPTALQFGVPVKSPASPSWRTGTRSACAARPRTA